MDDIKLFVDESGTVPKGTFNRKGFFVITILAVKKEDIIHVKKIFKNARLKVAKKSERLYRKLTTEHEIKGSEVTEKQKAYIYKKVLDKCGDKIELAVIVLDNKKATLKFRSNSSRVFNYLIKSYMDKCFRYSSKFRNMNQLEFIIDERNVATESKYTLQEYLNTELNLIGGFSPEDIEVGYYNSKKYLLLQFTDFISNTFYRKIQKNNKESEQNVDLLLKYTCKERMFEFPL